jgi:hypothetical protein
MFRVDLQQITKLDFRMFLVNSLEKLSESLHFYMVYKGKIYYSNICVWSLCLVVILFCIFLNS